MTDRRIFLLGAAGRVGTQVAAELMRSGFDLVLVDILGQDQLSRKAGRLLNDANLIGATGARSVTVHGGVNALDKSALIRLLSEEAPDLVINYAIPITWDATKRLPNYPRVSAAGLGAFTPIQLIAPLRVAEAIRESGLDVPYIVGNLPDITVPILCAIAKRGGAQAPLCGAGNVGLIQVAMRRQVSLECDVPFADVDVSLVAHHVHWVAPREPGYSNEAPFIARIAVGQEDVTSSFDDTRELMNRGVRAFYEADAAFSSTTGILAARVAMALLDGSSAVHRLHVPAPNGLPGGYPVRIQNHSITVDAPTQELSAAVAAMERCHKYDGVAAIEADGTVRFADHAMATLEEELGYSLPPVMSPSDIEAVAMTQIAALRAVFNAS